MEITIINHNGSKAVSARDLYLGMGLHKAHWRRWHVQNILNNPFAVENVDWTRSHHDGEKSTNDPRTADYALTISFAKKLAMQVRTEAGERVRDYFIEIERNAKLIADMGLDQKPVVLPKMPKDMLGVMELSIQHMREQDRRIAEVEKIVSIIDARTATRPDYFTIVGWANLHHIQINLTLAAALGRKGVRLAQERKLALDEMPDPRFGRVRLYPTEILQEIFRDVLSIA